MRRLAVTALLTATTLLAATACGGNSSNNTSPTRAAPGQPDKVAAGVIAIVDVAPIYLGKQKGFFSSRNIDLSLETSQGGAAIVPGVVSGQFQFGFSNMTSLILAKSRGLPIKVVANGVASTGKDGADFSAVLVKGDSPTQSAKDLAGKKVAVNTLKNIGDTTVRASVRKAGGDPSGIQFVELGFPDQPAALAAGRVDAIWVVEPFVTAAKGQGARVVASNYVDAAANLTVATYFTSQDLIAKNPDLVKRFKEAMAESLAYANAHPDEVRQIITTYTQITADVTAKITLPAWPAEVNKASVQTLTDLAVQDKLLDKAPALDDLIP
ncbi:ABC transporter substrate-binding protein [Dactylosporangium sp. AC04546]|uniref:ABC transporter substrate-binding protein n=1 Tax=Dactylosporangium sp. AC04546 TaxID=2862460 RepID=UPI001EDD0201|nr:ABC transporter substrate-binding protein [Dactylosporangium sp. AC04546]WVK85604.1 ABC transporter substrate-binding protein [Dactylosporangium sp. AC04546]